MIWCSFRLGIAFFVGTKFFPFLDDEVVFVIDEGFRNIQVNQPTFENWLILGKQIACGHRSSCGQLPFSNNGTFTNLKCSFSQMQSQGLNWNPRTLLKKPLLILTHCDPLAFRLFQNLCYAIGVHVFSGQHSVLCPNHWSKQLTKPNKYRELNFQHMSSYQ